MNRREFGKNVALAGGLLVMPSLTGCTVSPTEIAADGLAVANAFLAVAKILAVSNPNLAAQLTTAAQALENATANWTTGSTLALINDAAQALEAVLAVIPQTAVIAPLVAIGVAALDILIANVGVTTVTATSQAANPYRGAAKIHHRFGRSPEGDFKSAWNGVVATNPALASAKIQ